MSYRLNNKLSGLEPYEPISGDYDIRLDANESFIDLNSVLYKQYEEGLKSIALNRYPDSNSTKAIKAFAQFFDIDESYVTAGNGSDELISIISSCFLEKSDKIAILSPDFSMYSFYGSLYENSVLVLEKDKDTLNISADSVIDFVNSNNADMLIFSNPCNPTSQGISREDVLKIVENVSCLVVVDEAYMDFWDQSVLNEVFNFSNLIVLKTCSKAIGLAGVRFGFAVSSKLNTNALRAAKSPYNTDSISQKLVEITFLHKDLLKENINTIIDNTNDLYQKILLIKEEYAIINQVYKPATNFVFIKTDKSDEIYNYLLKNSIAVRCFNGFLRITAGTKYENDMLVKSFRQIVANL